MGWPNDKGLPPHNANTPGNLEFAPGIREFAQNTLLGEMTKFGNLVLKKDQNTKKGLKLVMSFLTLPGVLTTLMAHHHWQPYNS